MTHVLLHGINTSGQMTKSVTHVSGTKRHLCLKPLTLEILGRFQDPDFTVQSARAQERKDPVELGGGDR